jgi:hypothetical protein
VINGGKSEQEEKEIKRKKYHSAFCWYFGHEPIQMANKLEADNTSSKFLPESEPIYMVSADRFVDLEKMGNNIIIIYVV